MAHALNWLEIPANDLDTLFKLIEVTQKEKT